MHRTADSSALAGPTPTIAIAPTRVNAAVVTISVFLLVCRIGSLPAATITVTTAADSGAGSLRQAILDSNASPGPDFIQFSIAPGGPRSVVVVGALPTITDPVTIDGTTQPGFSGSPIIEVTGSAPYTGGFRMSVHSNTIKGLVLSQMNPGIYLVNGSSGNRVEGNWIGLDASGATNQGVNTTGIIIEYGSDNLIGGTSASARNVIAGCNDGAINIYSGVRNAVEGNYLGTDVTGTKSLGNGWSDTGGYTMYGGVYIEGGKSNVVGGANSGARNLIAGNSRGVTLNSHTTANVIQGNWIGLKADGTAVLPGRTQLSGIMIFTSEGNFIGGSGPGQGNVISGANGGSVAPGDGYGVQMYNSSLNIIQGNLIGTDASGVVPVPNLISGVSLSEVCRTNTIGGTSAGARNVISGNGKYGIYLRNSQNNLIQGNYIGTAVDGANPAGNGESGIFLYSGSGNFIGGTAAGAGNVIAHNGTSPNQPYHNGITLTESDPFTLSTGNAIRRNSFFGNAQRGIRLYTLDCSSALCPPPNDPGDADFGANNLQNSPVLTNAVTGGGAVTISGRLNSTPNATATIEFYASPEISPSGYGEGKVYLGQETVLTDSFGNAPFESSFSYPETAGRFISATATDLQRNTSEFAASIVADGPAGAFQFTLAEYSQDESLSLASVTVARVGGTTGTATVQYAITDGTATSGSDYTAQAGLLTFLDGQSSQTIYFSVLNDSANEPDETVQLSLHSPTGGAVLGSRTNATFVIRDNDPLYLYAADAAATKPASGTTIMAFQVYLSQSSSRTIAVSYVTTDVTALAGTDYLSATGRVVFPPGTTNQFIPVTVLADGLQEGTKSLLFTLSNPTNASMGDPSALGKIYDGTQGVLQFSSANYSLNEGNGTATITVTRVGGALGSVSVPFSVNAATGTATPGSDFTPTNGVLNFSNGQITRDFQVSVADDGTTEADETVVLILGTPTGTTLGTPASATLTIVDNDLPPSLAIRSLPGAVVLSWPTQAVGFSIMSRTNLSSGNWYLLAGDVPIAGDHYVFTNQISSTGKLFFRLQR